ncbi:MAG: two-component system response regulator HydG, partial [Saprospiraceae bacterium]
DRLEDLPVLAEHFLKMYARKYQREDIKFASNTLRKLEDYSWPGNIRELRHAVERAIILSEGKALRPEDFLLQDRGNSGEEGTEVIQTFNLDELEKWAIQKAMTKHRGNITKAATDLGITRAALYRRLEKYGL